MSILMSLIIDDGAPVNPMYFLHPEQDCKFIIPNTFTRKFAQTCEELGIKGKFSVMPIPSQLGRIDQKLNYVTKAHLAGFLEIVRGKIVPNFDITPEILTHQAACNLKNGGFLHVYEDKWVSTASVQQMTKYFALANQILKNVGLNPNGMTSPWATGIDNEKKYAEAIGNAQWRVFRRKFAWYFLHEAAGKEPMRCFVAYRNKKRGQVVVSLPANCGDTFWGTQNYKSRRTQTSLVNRGIDTLLANDGKTGRIRFLVDHGYPVTLCTHWQSLFSNGSAMGLDGLRKLAERINKVFGSEVKWTTCSKLARSFWLKSHKAA